MLRLILLTTVVLCCAPVVRSDTITLHNGNKVQGAIIEEGDFSVTVRLKTGTTAIHRSQIAKIEKDKATTQPLASLPSWDRCLSTAIDSEWGRYIRQIPATVIDAGVMKNVPYLSYRAGDYEINIYGDPAHPIGVEIGIYGELLKDGDAKQNCLRFIIQATAGLIPESLVNLLDLAGDDKEHEEYTVEITPETAEDAYGGWWISVYSEPGLDAARATEEEIRNISIAESEADKPVEAKSEPEIRGDATEARKRALARNDDHPWTSSEVTTYKKYRGGSPTVSSGGGGRVYVRGYTRKDGTYVRPHTRSRQRR